MTDEHDMFYCSFVSIDYIICECGATFPSEDDLKTHLEKEHPHKKERKEYKCGVCECIYATEQECINHYEESHMEIKLEHNYVVDPVKYETYEESGDPGYVYDEDYVQETYEVKSEPVEVVFENKYYQLQQIVETDEAEKKVKKASKKNLVRNVKNVVCEICGKKYTSKAALKYHQRVHTGERPYKCTECDKTFTMPLFLQIHVRTHTGERPYECPLCPKAFSNKAALLRHDRVHTGVKPYPCPKCGKAFTQSNSMKLHVNTVHLKMPAPYKSKTRRLQEKARALSALNAVKVKEETMEVPMEINTEEIELFEDDENVTYSLVYEV